MASLEEQLVHRLIAAGRSIATAESCTGGMLASTIVKIPGASTCFAGSAVTYWEQAKTDLLGVDPGLLAREGAVSAAVALAMASGAAKLFHTDYALAVTGLAGPGGGTPTCPVGRVYLALYDRGRTTHLELNLTGDRQQIRRAAATAALRLGINYLPQPPRAVHTSR